MGQALIVRRIDNRKNKISELKEEYTKGMDIINDMIMLDANIDFIFRGISNENQLRSSLYNKYGIDAINKEKYILDVFESKCDRYIESRLGTIDKVALAQHYGLPTRLIDWTQNPFIALYFAINKEIKEEYQIVYTRKNDNIVITEAMDRYFGSWSVKTGSLAKDFIKIIDTISNKEELESKISDYQKMFSDLPSHEGINKIIDYDKLVLFDSYATNDRLFAQQGLFSIPKKIEEGIAKDEILNNCKVTKIKISSEERGYLLSVLDRLGCDSYKLFPELESICDNINASFKSYNK